MASLVQVEPTSLWVEVIKGLYFPSSDFLHAVKGGKPSWAWTSLLAGRDALKDGAVWKLGGGNTIRLFTDAWIPGHYDSWIGHHPVTETQANLALEEWIDQSFRAWDEGKVRAAVTEEEAQRILRVPIPVLSKPDELRWPHPTTLWERRQ